MTEPTEPKGIIVQVGGATVRMGPVGFSLYAEEFYLAAISIPEHSRAKENTRFTPVPYYLLCRALELMLKAFLLAKNKPLDQLKTRYGHNLETLWRAAKEEGLLDILGAFEPEFETDLRKANTYYKDKAFEYFDFRRWAHAYEGLPQFERFRDETKKIVDGTKEYCFSVS
jgi:hypothetical protein